MSQPLEHGALCERICIVDIDRRLVPLIESSAMANPNDIVVHPSEVAWNAERLRKKRSYYLLLKVSTFAEMLTKRKRLVMFTICYVRYVQGFREKVLILFVGSRSSPSTSSCLACS
uniref:Uncharacterized protein n=1 Tax=Vespula pensylvanica TaxID=30213 RepID=A0A834PFU6_VESPE|nr:hypothetical protein H0235_001271 [Vespula pensylvanica]